MSQGHFRGDVSDGIHAGQVGAHQVVNTDRSALAGGGFAFPVKVVDRRSAHAEQHFFSSDHRAVREQQLLLFASLPDALHSHAGFDGYAGFLEGHGEAPGDFFVLQCYYPRQELNDLGLDAEGVHDGGELTANHPASHHSQAAGQGLEVENSGGGQNVLFVDLDAGKTAWLGTCGNDQVLGAKLGAGVSAQQVGIVLPGDADGFFQKHRNLSFAEEEFHAAHKLGNDLFLTLENLAVIQIQTGDSEAEGISFFHLVPQFCAFYKGFGGDAANVEAHSPNAPLFHQGAVYSILVQPDGGFITPGASSNDEDLIIRQKNLPYLFLSLLLRIPSSKRYLAIILREITKPSRLRISTKFWSLKGCFLSSCSIRCIRCVFTRWRETLS